MISVFPFSIVIFFKSLLCFMGGIVAQAYISWPLLLSLFLWSIFCFGLVYLNSINCNLATIHQCLWCLFFIGGALIYSLHSHSYTHLKTALSTKHYAYHGIIENVTTKPTPYSQEKIAIRYDFIQEEGSSVWIYYPGSLEIYVQEKTHLKSGDVVEVGPLAIRPLSSKKQNTKGRSFEFYLIKEGIADCLHIKKLSYKPSTNAFYFFKTVTLRLKEKLYTSLKTKLSAPAFSFFSTIFLGNKKNNLFDQAHLFNIWGISHYLARSGLHLVIIIAFLNILFSFIPLPFFIKQSAMFFFTIIYWHCSWGSISFFRALLLYLFSAIALIHKKRFYSLYALMLICFGTLAYNPFYLFFLDFQLTFLFTLALSWFNYYQAKLQM